MNSLDPYGIFFTASNHIILTIFFKNIVLLLKMGFECVKLCFYFICQQDSAVTLLPVAAHLHHAVDRLRAGITLPAVILISSELWPQSILFLNDTFVHCSSCSGLPQRWSAATMTGVFLKKKRGKWRDV